MTESGAMYSPVTVDAHWYAGTDRFIDFDIVDADGARLNVASFSLEYKLINPAGSAVFSKTTVSGSVTVISSLGDSMMDRVRVPALKADTSALASAPALDYFHYLRRIDAGSYNPLAIGPVAILAYPGA